MGCVFPIVVFSILPHAELGPNFHRKGAFHFTRTSFPQVQVIFSVSKIKDNLVEDERVEDMVTLFKYVDPDIKKHTLHILYNLANDFNIRPVLCELSRPIMEFCLTNIISQYKVIQELSLGIVYSMCVEEEAFEVFVELDGIKKMFLFIQNKEVRKDYIFYFLYTRRSRTLHVVWNSNCNNLKFILCGLK